MLTKFLPKRNYGKSKVSQAQVANLRQQLDNSNKILTKKILK